jgi:hypothetical protein
MAPKGEDDPSLVNASNALMLLPRRLFIRSICTLPYSSAHVIIPQGMPGARGRVIDSVSHRLCVAPFTAVSRRLQLGSALTEYRLFAEFTRFIIRVTAYMGMVRRTVE